MARIIFTIVFTFLFLLPLVVCGQTMIEPNKDDLPNNVQNKSAQEKREIFQFQVPDSIKVLEELVDMRDLTSKQFKSSNGEMTALLAAGPLHYEENGQWKDINHKITKNNLPNYPFANTSNLLMTFFGETVNYGIISQTKEEEELLKEFMNVKMFWEINQLPQNIIEANDAPIQVDGSIARYENIFGQVSAEFTIESGRKKLDYIIPSVNDLPSPPVNAEYLVFSEDI
ncbi:MAG: hypothetical protein JJT77_13550, partial [Crocinitomicaceae bacterium]|nr:hypothetical protein [Crocinitomicaceae bacterium]